MNPQTDLFDTKEAAEYIGHAVGTLNNWRVTGEGPKFIKPRRKVFYPKAELDAWLEQNGLCKTTAQARVKSHIRAVEDNRR